MFRGHVAREKCSKKANSFKDNEIEAERVRGKRW